MAPHSVPLKHLVSALSGNIECELYKLLDNQPTKSLIGYLFNKEEYELFDVHFTDSNMLDFRDFSSDAVEPLLNWAKKEHPELIQMALEDSAFKVLMEDGTVKCPFVYNQGEDQFELLASAVLAEAPLGEGRTLAEAWYWLTHDENIPISWDISEEKKKELAALPLPEEETESDDEE
jgi:hypothetical protein